MTVIQQHNINEAEAITRLKSLVNKLSDENKSIINSLNQYWTGNNANVSVKVMAMNFKGHIIVTSKDVAVKLNIPFAASFFRNQIKEQIVQHLKNTLS